MTSQPASISDVQTNGSRIDHILSFAAAFSVLLLIFGPLVAVSMYIATPAQTLATGAAEATVGVGVILRAVGRRLFRAGATHTIRITFGTITRTVARTITTRLVKLFIRSVAGSIAKDMMAAEKSDKVLGSQSFAAPVFVGTIATALSFWGVLSLAGADLVEALNQELHLPVLTLLVGAAIPLVCFALAGRACALLFSADLDLRTGIDGLLVQAYFTFSGAFLPMTTDIEFKGGSDRCAKAAACSLLIMLTFFVAFRTIGSLLDHDFSIYLSAMFLIYSFVYAFPVKPLLGNSIWAYNKWWWLLTFLPIILGFIFAFPGAVAALL
jgi:hypothetical protein